MSQPEHPTIQNIYRAVTVASSTDAILVFLFPILLINYFSIPVALVTVIYTVVRVISPCFPYITGWIIDRCDLRRLLIIAYQIALSVPLILIAAYLIEDLALRFALALLAAILNTIVFSLVIGQEALIAELSDQPQRAMLKMFSFAHTALFLGSLGLTLYFATLAAIIPLLIVKAVTDMVALSFTIRGMSHAPQRQLRTDPQSRPEPSSAKGLASWRLLLSLVTMSTLLGLTTYFATYLVPVSLNSIFGQTYIVSASFVIFSAANGAVNFWLMGRLPDRVAATALIGIFVAIIVCLWLFGALTGSMGGFALWIVPFSLLFSFLQSISRLHMVLKVPDHLKGRMRGGLQALMGLCAGGLAWIFLSVYGNDPVSVARTGAIIALACSCGYLLSGLGTQPNRQTSAPVRTSG